MTTEQSNELRKLADPLVPWCVTSAWEGEEGTAWLGNISYDDSLRNQVNGLTGEIGGDVK